MQQRRLRGDSIAMFRVVKGLNKVNKNTFVSLCRRVEHYRFKITELTQMNKLSHAVNSYVTEITENIQSWVLNRKLINA